MKTLFLFIIFCIALNIDASAQMKKITIDAFVDTTVTKFDDGSSITLKDEKDDGFTLQIMNTAGVTQVQMRNTAGTFNNAPTAPPITNGKTYIIKDAALTNGNLEIQIIKAGASKIITLVFTPLAPAAPAAPVPPLCTLPETKIDCVKAKNNGNKFGEDANSYGDNDIVYIYDFNSDISKRQFYKIKKASNTLDMKVANFNTEKLRRSDNVKFKIVNINKFMYDVSISDSIISYDSEPSALFTKLFLGDSTLLGNLISTFSSKKGISAQNSDDDVKALIENINCFIQKYNSLQSKVLEAYNPCHEFPCCYNVDYLMLINDLVNIRSATASYQNQINKQKALVAQNDKSVSDCDANSLALANNAKDIAAFKGTPAENQAAKKEDLTALIKTQTDLTAKATDCTPAKIAGYKKNSADAIDKLSTMSALNDLITKLPSDQDLRKVSVFLNNMVSQNNTHSLDYISLKGNALDLKIKISSRDSLFKYFGIPEYKNDAIHITIPVLFSPFVNFSSGSFVAIGKNLQNKTYDWQPAVGANNTIDSSKYTLRESGYSAPVMGFSALGSVEWKFSPSMGFGASAGVGLTIESIPRLSYLAGGSLFFGDARQFAVTAGFIGIQVNKLNKNFQVVADNQIVYPNKVNLDYYKEFKVGAFLSLTYTPFKSTKNR